MAAVRAPSTSTGRAPNRALTASDPSRGPVIAVGALLLGTVLAIGTARLAGVGDLHAPDAPAVAVREFRFDDRPDGSIDVLEAPSGRRVSTVAPGTNGFLRGTMRGLARERMRRGIGPETPFRMVGRADGALTLEDPTTGRRVDIASFGPANSSVFGNIMAARPAP